MADTQNEAGSQAGTPMEDTQLDQVSGGAYSPSKGKTICLECGWESSWSTSAQAESQWDEHAAATGHSVSVRHSRT